MVKKKAVTWVNMTKQMYTMEYINAHILQNTQARAKKAVSSLVTDLFL